MSEHGDEGGDTYVLLTGRAHSGLTSHSFYYSLISLETNRWNLSLPSSNAFHVVMGLPNTKTADSDLSIKNLQLYSVSLEVVKTFNLLLVNFHKRQWVYEFMCKLKVTSVHQKYVLLSLV